MVPSWLDWRLLAQLLGTISALIGLAICLRLAFVTKEDMAEGKKASLGLVSLPAAVFFKLLALAAFLVLPPATVFLGSYHLFEGIKETQSCMSCHVMNPMGNDLYDPESNSLAARHYRNKWIPDKHCYSCHADYGLSGTLEAKAEGFRHLARYTTGTYREPIRYKMTFNNENCLHCHGGTPKFAAVKSHHTASERLGTSGLSCLNCHGAAHPSRERRTPGHADYEGLMRKPEPPGKGKK